MKNGDVVKSVVTGRVGKVICLFYDGIHIILIKNGVGEPSDTEYLQHKEMRYAS